MTTLSNDFFTLLQSLMDKFNFKAENIYNVDETDISIVPKSCSRVVARTGHKQVGGKTAAERGETVTAEICMSAAGAFMPPMLIFPRVKENKELLEGAPAGAWAEFHKSGWIQVYIYTRWFRRFINYSHASKDNPVLLLLDGHVSHVKNLEVIELAMEHGVEIICFPPHCAHRMQPLDVGFMKPISHYYTEEVNAFQRTGERVTLKNLFLLFAKAFMNAGKIDTVNANSSS
ncbi:uncharacterized protein LOC116738583 [Nasonia vitripennis]|uniref:DDE-1 domain-containing protein n=1 Tax=Nasonia vitripennis TaxID=7425 RepID=A0A7M7QYS8_NASVI|nr:uncharacterized protein LOC116738583 [Nasonia vitripennis]XP_032455648.1 uncharacterized protein LOC116738583 [Nasonia vitripennis]